MRQKRMLAVLAVGTISGVRTATPDIVRTLRKFFGSVSRRFSMDELLPQLSPQQWGILTMDSMKDSSG
jgi:hypothetical protein